VEFGREADLGVDDAVGRQILGAFGRNPLERLQGLHDRHGVGKPFQVEDEVLAVCTPPEPGGEVVRVGGRETDVACLAGELDDGGGAEPAVEVVVEEDFRSGPDRGQVQRPAPAKFVHLPALRAPRGPATGSVQRHQPTGRSCGGALPATHGRPPDTKPAARHDPAAARAPAAPRQSVAARARPPWPERRAAGGW